MGIYRVRTQFTGLSGGPYLSTMYFAASPSPDVVEAQAAATDVAAYWNAIDAELDLKLSWSTLGEVALIDEVTGNLTNSYGVVTASGAGAKSGDSIAPFTQALCRWSTATFIAGRRVQGRTFVPGMTEVNTTANGAPAAVLTNLITTAGNALIASANSGLVVWSRKNGSIALVTACSAWNQYAVLRSRRD